MPLAPSLRHAVSLCVLALLASASGHAQQPFDIALRDGLLSIRANGASVNELADALAAETGISFVVTGDGGTPITAEIVDEPFVKAVAKLSPNHLLVRDGKSPDSPVIEVVLMLDESGSGGSGGDGGFLPSGAPADEIIGDDSAVPMDEFVAEEVPMDEIPTDEVPTDELPMDEMSIDDTMNGSGVGTPNADGTYDGTLPAQ